MCLIWNVYCDLYEFYWEVNNSKEKYSRAPVSTDSVSAVSIIRGLPRFEKKFKN
jgi:hypothetical protein